jgi:major vault protein
LTTKDIVDVHEEQLGWIPLTTLQENQYCIITNPVDPKTGKNLLGKRKLVVGETFFQLPG